MRKNIFLALSFALGLTMAVSCNQTQANDETALYLYLLSAAAVESWV